MDSFGNTGGGGPRKNAFIQKEMIYTTAAIQQQIMSGLQGGGGSAANLSAVYGRPSRARMDPMQVDADAQRSKKLAGAAVQNIEANKFQDNGAPKGGKESGGRADAYLFREVDDTRGFTLVGGAGARGEEGPGGRKRAASPEVGASGSQAGVDRPQTVKMRSGKSVEARGLAGGRAGPSGVGGNVSKNFSYKQRVKHFADPVDYPQLNYEKRIKDLARNSITKTKLNAKVVETWLNETLTDAGHLEIPGVILQPESQKPLMRYKIGKNQLQDDKVSLESTARIYRALFVYSLGFYEMLQKEISHSPNRNSIQNSIWKVFSILLEYCCKTNYQMLVRGLQIEHKAEMDKEEDRFNEYQDRMMENENKLKHDLGFLHGDNERMGKDIEELKRQNKKLQEDMTFERKNHEEEVQLRLQFESKLNSLHALHRDVKNLYSRATEEILELKTQNDEKDKIIKSHKEELIDLRTIKENNHQQILTFKESLAYAENELNIKTNAIKKLQEDLLQKDRENDKLQQDVNNQEQIYYGLQMEISKAKSDIQTLGQDKERLEIELGLTKQMREQFCDQLEDVSKKYKELLAAHNTIQKDFVAIDELKRDRDRRINELRQELAELSEKHDQLSKDNAALTIRHESTMKEFNDLKAEDEKLAAQLEEAEEIRRQQQQQCQRLREDHILVAQRLEEAKDELLDHKRSNEKLQQRLEHAERDIAELQVRYDSEQKQSEIQRHQLNDKLKNLDQLLCNEKDTRETWMGKCQLEQEMHTKTNVELLRVRSLHQNAEMEHKNAVINLDTVKEARATLATEHEELLKEASQLRAKNENLEREVYAKLKLLQSLESQQKVMLRQLREENKKLIEENEVKVLEQQMLYEDLRSHCVKKHAYAGELLAEIENLKEKLQVQKEENEALDRQIAKQEEAIEAEQEAYKELKNDANELRLQHAVKESDLEKAHKQLADHANRIAELALEARKAGDLVEQVKHLDQQKAEVEKQLKHAQELLENELREKDREERGCGPDNVLFADQEVQTEPDYAGLDPAMMDGQNDGMVDYSQQNSFQTTQLQQQQQHLGIMISQPAATDNQSMMMRNTQLAMGQGSGSSSHQGLGIGHGGITPKTHQLNQMQLNQASHLNISNSNIRQAISLGKGPVGAAKGGPGRIQSAVNTAQSTAFGTRGAAGVAQMNLMSQGYQTGGLSSHGAMISQDGQTRNSKAQMNRTISGDADSKSADGKYRHAQGGMANQAHGSAEAGRNNLAAAMGAQAGLDLSLDDQYQRYGAHGGRPTTGVPMAYRGLVGSRETPMMQGQVPAPHALYNHQAYSKKSFRIRGQAEQELMKMQLSSSNKDMAIIDFNNDILKSVYELRKSHAALAGRPTSSQPFSKGRRDIQSAAARQKEMAFGGFMLPAQLDQVSAENFQLPNAVEPTKILEIDEAHPPEGTLQPKDKKAKSMRTSIPNNAPLPRHPGPISQIQIQQKPALSTLKAKKPATAAAKSPAPDQPPDKTAEASHSGASAAQPQVQQVGSLHGLRTFYNNDAMSVSGNSIHVMSNAMTGANPHHFGAMNQRDQPRNSSVLTSGSQAEGLKLAESLSTFQMNAVITTKSAGNIKSKGGRNIKNIIKMASSREGLADAK